MWILDPDLIFFLSNRAVPGHPPGELYFWVSQKKIRA